jgi:hypothetical protein
MTGSESPWSGDTGNVTVVLDNGDRELQRIVSAHRYYGSETKRQDILMISREQRRSAGPHRQPSASHRLYCESASVPRH